jgi:hypothetical protein
MDWKDIRNEKPMPTMKVLTFCYDSVIRHQHVYLQNKRHDDPLNPGNPKRVLLWCEVEWPGFSKIER